MGQITSLVVNDGTGNRTFVFAEERIAPQTGDQYFRYEDRSGGLPLAYPSIELVWKLGTASPTSARTLVANINYPVALAATATTPATVSHTLRRFNGKTYIPNKSTAAERTVLANLVKNLEAHASIQLIYANGEAPYK